MYSLCALVRNVTNVSHPTKAGALNPSFPSPKLTVVLFLNLAILKDMGKYL